MKKETKVTGLVKRGEIWWVRKMVNGVLIQKSTGCKDQQEAFCHMTALIASPVVMYGAGGYSFEALIPKFIQFKKSTGAFSRFSKKDKEGILWRLARAFGAKSDIRTVSEKLIIETLTSGRFQTIKPITRNSYLSALKSFYTWAYKIEKLTQNHVAREITPFKELKKSDQMKRKNELICVKEEFQFMIWVALVCADYDMAFILIMGFCHGLRRNEISEIRPAWFDFDRGIITVRFLEADEAKKDKLDEFIPKWGKARDIPIDPQYRIFLEDFVKGKDYCLAPLSRRGIGRYRHDFQKKYSNFMRYLQMKDVTIHTMRHSFASDLSRQGRPIGEIAMYLGDSIEVTENHYLHHQPYHKDFSYLYGEALIQAREQKLAESWKEIKKNRWLNIKNKTLPEVYTQQNLDVLLKISRAED
jgi:integrase